MKNTALLTALLCSFGSQAGELKLELHGNGLAGQLLLVEVFNSMNAFMHENRAIRTIKADASADSTTLLIQNLAPGKYAIAAFADDNRNGKLDKNFLGRPTELYGFSNDASGKFGPPEFDEASFELSDGKVAQSIHLH